MPPQTPDAPLRPSVADPLLGTVLHGKFRVDQALGKGGAGKVYVATQLSLGRPVALKVLRDDVNIEGDERFVERFYREAALAGALSHPNVVTVHDYGRTDEGICYIAMELLDGRSLKQILRDGPMELERALDLFEQVVRGLRHAHRAGLVHRDVKPGNVLVVAGDDGREVAKLLDFGLVKSAAAEVTEITRDGSFLGTPHYAAPEQVRGLPTDARADLYAVGVMMYRALTGRLPYESRNAMALAMAHVRDPYPAMAERAPGSAVPAAVEAVVRRCMEKEPDARFPDADALLSALLAARQGLALPAPPRPAPEAPPEEPTLHRPARRWVAGGLLGAGLGSALVSAALLAMAVQGSPAIEAGADAPDRGAEAVAVADAEAPGADLLADDAPLVLSVPLAVASVPAGASVEVDGQVVGVTPYVGQITLRDGAPPPVWLRLEGHEPAQLSLALDPAGATGAAELRPARATPRATPRKEEPAPRGGRSAGGGGGAVVVDGVAFTAAEAAAALRFANAATPAELQGAGISGRQASAVQAGRPYADLAAVGAAYGVGEKTMQRLKTVGR